MAQVSSIRDSQYEWMCETQSGSLISGHTRQDKAFQSCINLALADGLTYIVRGGTYRVKATGTTPPVEPPVEPCEWDATIPADDPLCVEPPVEPPVDPVTFGPATSIIVYPATISALKQDPTRWEITFTLNSVGTIQGLASRDQYGTNDAGHLSVWVDEIGRITARNQGLDGQVQTALVSQTVVVPGVEYVVDVNVSEAEGFSLYVNGQGEDSALTAYGSQNNDLPMVLAGRCTLCTADGSVGPDRPIDGVVAMTIHPESLPLPGQPVATVMLNWENPTEDTNDDPLPDGIPDRITIYTVGAVGQSLVADLDGESIAYEVTGLLEGEHCFVARAWWDQRASDNSNTVCKVAE
jgi:hypothetical protein